MLKKSLFFILILLQIGSGPLSGQIDTSYSNPYSVIYNHLYFLQNDTYNPEKSILSFSPDLESRKARQLSIKLKQILDGRGLFVKMSQVPDDPNYQDTLSNKNLYYLFPNELPEIYVEKTAVRWQYSAETVKVIPSLHKKTYPFGTDYLLNLVPEGRSGQFLGLNTWQFLGVLFFILAGAFLFLLLRIFFRPILKKISKLSFHIDMTDKKLLNRTSHLISLLIVFVLIRYLFPILQLPVKWTLFTRRTLDIVITVFVALLLLRVLDYLLDYFRIVTSRTESKMDDQLMPIVSQVVKLVVIIGAIIQILHLVNVNVTALIAGISIGGLALALAAKDTVSNLIGSLMVFMDKPFQIGDYIEVDGFGGTVKEVGFRSTRIQTKDTSIISIPNGSIANTALVNKGIRVFRLFETVLGVAYDTPPHLIEIFVEGLKKLTLEHPDVSNEGYYINLSGLGSSSIDILYRVYLNTNDYAEELNIKEDLILKILRMSEQIGARFAFPSTTVYVEQFPGQKDLIPSYPETPEESRKKLDDFFYNLKKKD